MNKGKLGEKLAELYLEREGYHILQRNYHCIFGEIDLIADKERILCFVEVKLRSSLSFGYPAEAVNSAKRFKLRQAATFYLQQHPRESYEPRMDVLEILLINEKPYFHHIQSAF